MADIGKSSKKASVTRAEFDDLSKKLSSLQAENDDLRDEIAHLENDQSASSTGPNTSADKELIRERARAEQEHNWAVARGDIRRVAQLYSIINQPWVPSSLFVGQRLHVLRVDPEELSPQEHAFYEVAAMCTPDSRGYLTEECAHIEFSKSVNKQRSNNVYRLRRHALPSISNLSPGSDEAKRAIGWNGSRYKRDCDILFEKPNGARSSSTRFKNITAQKALRAIVHGTGAIENGQPAVGHTIAAKLGIGQTTPGLIAGTFILLRFALSPDKSLDRIGNVTGIRYEKDFRYYKSLLEKLEGKKVGVELFQSWDAFVFPNGGGRVSVEEEEEDDTLDEAFEEIEGLSDFELDDPDQDGEDAQA